MAVSKKQQKARLARLAVRDAADLMARFEGDDTHRETVDAEGLRAIVALSALQRETANGPELEQVLRDDVGFDEVGSAAVRHNLEAVATFQRKALGPLARVPPEEATTARLAADNLSWIQSSECREELLRRVGTTARSADAQHEFAPFLEWLARSDVLPKVRAEALARIDLYICSGHASADLSFQEEPDPRHAETVLKMRQVAERLRRGEDVPEREVSGVLERRFKQIFQPVRIQRNDGCEQGTLPLATAGRGSGFSLFADEHGSTEGSGIVDAVIADRRDPTRWHMACTTANDNPFSQSDQLPRHATGLLNSMAIGRAPFSRGDTLASLTYYAPAYLTAARREWLGRGLELNEDECSALNATQLYAQLAHSRINRNQVEINALLWAQHRVAGGRSAAQGGIGRPVSDLVREAGESVVRAARALAHPDRAIEQEKHGSGFVGPLIDLLVGSAKGLYSHFAAEAEPFLRDMLPSLRALSAQTNAAGYRDRALTLRSLGNDIEAIDASVRAEPLPARRLPTDRDLAPLERDAWRLARRESMLEEHLRQSEPEASAAVVRRLRQLARLAHDDLWEAALTGTVSPWIVEAQHRNGVDILAMDEATQQCWLASYTQTAPAGTKKRRP